MTIIFVLPSGFSSKGLYAVSSSYSFTYIGEKGKMLSAASMLHETRGFATVSIELNLSVL